MKPLSIEAPWSVVHGDLMEMIPSADGHTHLLIIRCGSSGYSDFYALFSKEKKEVLTALLCCFSHYGLAGTTIMDEGGEFQNTLLSEFNIRLKIASKAVTPDAHHANGTAEKAVSEVRAYCRKFQVGDRWHEHIPFLRYAINSRSLPRLGNRSPAEILQGRKFLHPVDFEAGLDFAPFNLEETEKRVALVRQEAASALAKARERMKTRHDSQRGHGDKFPPLKAGELVCISSQDASRGHKDRPQWYGPVQLTRVALDGLRCFFEDEEGVERTVPAHLVQRYVLRPLRWIPAHLLDVAAEEEEKKEEEVGDATRGEDLSSESSLPSSSSSSSGASNDEEELSPSFESSESSAPELEIKSIVGARGSLGGDRQYRVHWKGYTHGDNTWEPEKNVPASWRQKAIKSLRIPPRLPPDEVHYRLHIGEVHTILRLTSCRRDGHRQERIFHVVMTGDQFQSSVKVDIEWLPEEVFSQPQLWDSEELYAQGQRSFKRFRP